MTHELHWHPSTDDPAFDAGYDFAKRHLEENDGHRRWLVRQAFWCGVNWAREQSPAAIELQNAIKVKRRIWEKLTKEVDDER